MDARPSDRLVFGVEQSASGKRWIERHSDPRAGLAISQQYDLPEIVGRILNSRGVDLNEVDSYLNPRLNALLPDPAHLKDMDVAVDRICRAIADGDGLAVFGDYDVDGATSSALLKNYFTAIGVDLRIYIPDRLAEGYGPNIAALGKLKDEGRRVIITVDCGTTAFEPLALAKEQGLDVIIVDHHVAETALPDAMAVVNPNRLDDDSPHGQLAAVGVTFLLLVALNRQLREQGFFGGDGPTEPDLLQSLDLVALGTVADVVPLVGVNRALVVQGLKVMAMRRNTGLTALSDVAGIDEAPSAYHLGFILGPRVNAGGRVGASHLGARLLSCRDAIEAKDIAEQLDVFNIERRAIEDVILVEALEKSKSLTDDALLFVEGQDWHPGVIGIIASRLKERYSRPVFVVATDGEKGVGSGRSITGVDLGSAIIAARQKGLLVNGGGHPMAAGFTCVKENLPALKEFLVERVGRNVAEAAVVPTIVVDGALTIDGAGLDLARQIERLGPFGSGNAEPRFAFSGLRLVKADIVGTAHVRCIFTDSGGGRLAAISFRSVDMPLGHALLNHGGMALNVVGKIRENIWQGRSTVQLMIDDAAPSVA